MARKSILTFSDYGLFIGISRLLLTFKNYFLFIFMQLDISSSTRQNVLMVSGMHHYVGPYSPLEICSLALIHCITNANAIT